VAFQGRADRDEPLKLILRQTLSHQRCFNPS
jgi:hypothetical protein